jgi:hypothetical protein
LWNARSFHLDYYHAFPKPEQQRKGGVHDEGGKRKQNGVAAAEKEGRGGGGSWELKKQRTCGMNHN